MNSKQRRTLTRIFEVPTRTDIPWSDIEGLFGAVGGVVAGVGGSRVGVKLGGMRAVFHAPHPRPHTDKGTVERIRDFLSRAGVGP